MYARSRQYQGFSLWNILIVGFIAMMSVAAVIMLLGDRSKKPETIAYSPGDQARALIAQLKEQQGRPDLDILFDHSEEFIATSQLEDAHLLLFYAARLGHAPSARVLASMYDPNHHSNLTSIMDKPDPAQAYKWYKIAADAGDGEARARLSVLRSLVEQNARKGNDQAKLLLLQWQ